MLDKDQIAKIVSSAKAHPPSSHEVGVNLMNIRTAKLFYN